MCDDGDILASRGRLKKNLAPFWGVRGVGGDDGKKIVNGTSAVSCLRSKEGFSQKRKKGKEVF